MSEAYAFFAHYYDRFMEEAPYEAWLDWIMEMTQPLHRHVGESVRILDLGCGTGNLAIPLAMNGHFVVGTDLSAPMINVAIQKAQSLRADDQRRLVFQVQDMTRPMDEMVASGELFDVVVCCCDSLNYITDAAQVLEVFQHVRKMLSPGGLFLFDVHTNLQLKSYMQDQPYIWNDPDVAYIWTCTMEDEQTIQHELVLFAQTEQGKFERVEEVHRQRIYEIDWLKQGLRDARLEAVQVTADFSPFPVTEQSRRAFFVAVAV